MGGRAYFTLGLDLLTRGYNIQLPMFIKFTLDNPIQIRGVFALGSIHTPSVR
ncbi:RNA degradosome polyphosphate kinase [Sesbania bispinosa]|nr:RNA degradosome polyphosphate kinase [Sesbania bispinosa]